MNSGLILDHSGFVLANAQRLAQASADAYLSAGDEAASLASKSNPVTAQLIANSATDTHVRLTEFDDCVILAFRGTRDWRNWLTDAEFPLRPIGIGAPACSRLKTRAQSLPGLSEVSCAPSPVTAGPPIRVHEGFLTALDSVLTDIIGALFPGLEPTAHSLKPLVITGHSLGGALAVLCAYLLQRQGFPVHSVYTFGQPRVGDRAFAADYEALCGGKTFRLVNQNDLVPRLPGWLLGYRHAGQMMFINVTGALLANPSLLNVVINDALGLWQAWRCREDVLVTEHFMTAYLRSLNNPGLVLGAETAIPTAETRMEPGCES